ncbi:MAG: hypothetical protein WCH46_03015 [bacterium]
MSKGGGAGKVYFILYLAVLLELLIIIVERDDAEEELKKEKAALEQKSKRIQLIAETIINALRGSQTSLSSTSDQAMTLGDPKEPEREFSVKVRISDPTKDVVDSLALTILRNNSIMQTVDMVSDTVNFPRVKIGQDYIFKYKFKPSFGEGEYKLAFKAKTNQVVGVAQNAKADDTVKIGAVRLTVSELKDVEKGITENVALKGFIDSLLGNMYQDFSSNIGENDFVVNVKRAENKFDQLAMFPQDEVFTSFPGLELPNPIKIEGALSSKTEITKIEGPGEFKKVDTNWVWVFNPGQGEVGQAYTVKFKGDAKRGGGPKDIATKEFNVRVEGLKPAAGDSGMFVPQSEDEDKAQPFTKFPFVVNGKYTNLNGFYKIVISVDGKEVKVSNEPTASYTPVYLEDENKKLNVKILFRSQFAKDYKELKSEDFTILPPPLIVGKLPPRWEIGGNTTLKFQAAVGLLSSGADYQSELPGDLDVQSENNVFDSKATKVSGYDYTLRLLKPPANVKKDGVAVKITFKDPKTGMSKVKTVIIMPKKR